jgi:hypothetical protein
LWIGEGKRRGREEGNQNDKKGVGLAIHIRADHTD